MQVFHTAGLPPSIGSNSFAIIGCTRNNRPAPEKIAMTNRISIECFGSKIPHPKHQCAVATRKVH